MNGLQRLEHAIEHAADRLPAQGPISSFVHHNPLHAFESSAFDSAAPEASALLGCESLMSEAQYRAALAGGRILPRDLHAVVAQALGATPAASIAGMTSREELWVMRLRHPIREERGAALRWHLVETDALTRFRDDVDPRLRAWAHARYGSARMTGRDAAGRAALGELWKACVHAATLANEAPARVQSPRYLRPRDTLLAATGEDADALVHPLLIRLSAAYLDQGIAYWPMQDRELGVYRCVRSLIWKAGGRAATRMAR